MLKNLRTNTSDEIDSGNKDGGTFNKHELR